MQGSDEEADESPEADSDEDLNDGEKHLQEEVIYIVLLVDDILILRS